MRVTKEDYNELLDIIMDGFLESEYFSDTLYDGEGTIECVDDIYTFLSDEIWSSLHDNNFMSSYVRLTDEEKENYIETHKDLLAEVEKNYPFGLLDGIPRAIKRKDYLFLETTILKYLFSDEWEEYVYHKHFDDLERLIADRDEHFQQEGVDMSSNFSSEVELSDEEYDEGFDEALNRGLSVGKRKANLLSEGSKKGYKRF